MCLPMYRGSPVLRAERVILRGFDPGDADGVFVACQDPDVQRFTPLPVPYRRGDAVDFVREQQGSCWCTGRSLAVTDVVTGSLVGSMAARRAGVGFQVGYWTAPHWRRRGLTAAALRTFSCWLLTQPRMRRVELIIEPANPASIRTAERAGFRRVPGPLGEFVLRGRTVPVVVYVLESADPIPP